MLDGKWSKWMTVKKDSKWALAPGRVGIKLRDMSCDHTPWLMSPSDLHSRRAMLGSSANWMKNFGYFRKYTARFDSKPTPERMSLRLSIHTPGTNFVLHRLLCKYDSYFYVPFRKRYSILFPQPDRQATSYLSCHRFFKYQVCLE